MANRSYLYSVGSDAAGKRKVCGLSEYGYAIPLSYKILASQDPKISESIIWEYKAPIAIKGDFYKGRQKLFDFLAELMKMDIFDVSILKGQIKTTKEFLLNKSHENKSIILECGEVLAMKGNGKIEDHNRMLFDDEIKNIDVIMENYLKRIETIGKSKGGEVEALRMLGIDYWSDVLYYSPKGSEPA
jgi:hypothetical protein